MNEVVEKVESKFRWYSLKVISGKELLAKDNILFESESAIGMLKDSDEYKAASEDRQKELVGSITGFIDEILVPSEKVVEIRNNKKKMKEKMFFPGYILINMIMNAQTKYIVENTHSVIKFVGSKSGDPIPLRMSEIKRIMGEVERKDGIEIMAAPFEKGDNVKVISGPFLDFSGSVEEINEDKQKVKVIVSIFGRPTSIELDFFQVELDK
jgi:transcriptional antiterminator NusG